MKSQLCLFLIFSLLITSQSSFIPGWPDAIRCGSKEFFSAIYFMHAAGSYVQVYPDEYRYVTFELGGEFKSRAGHDGSSAGCDGKSISQLEAEGRTYYFAQNRKSEL